MMTRVPGNYPKSSATMGHWILCKHQSNGGAVTPVLLSIMRPSPWFSEAEGSRHSTGMVDGRTVFNYINAMSDETPDPTDLADGAVGYLDRWAGQGNAARRRCPVSHSDHGEFWA